MSDLALERICQKLKISIPIVQLLPDYWYVEKGAKLGGIKRMEIYGPPGTKEGRIEGGRMSQLRRRLNPKEYLNCNLRKNIPTPEKSTKLAELIGIILGDGGITNTQLKITLNKEVESEYISVVVNLLTDLFGEEPKKYYFSEHTQKVCNIVFSGVQLIEILGTLGLFPGNKVSRQAKVPEWIVIDHAFSKSCLRGLVDTDGCVFLHKHYSFGNYYLNLGITFTNHSLPLLHFVYTTLTSVGFHPKIQDDGVYLYRASEVVKYANEIGFSNTHHALRLNQFLELKKGGVA
ncbi:MAG: LAGLIDADG family homing endonuclease [Patescibacteria group bacterium]